MSSVEDRFIKVLNGYAGATEIKPNDNFVDDLGLDSMDTIELLGAIEEEFGMAIDHSVAEKLLTVRDAVDYIKAHLRE